MSKSLKHIKSSERKLILEALYNTARSMPKDDPVGTFITTVLTDSEQILVGRRLLIAQMLLSGKKQAEIMYELNVSPNTFSRTRKWLRGQIPEYDKAIKAHKLEQEQLSGKVKYTHGTPTNPFSIAALKKKYPAHFLLLTLVEQANNKSG